MSDIVKVVVEDFDSEGNLVKRTTTTTEPVPVPVAWRVPGESGSGGLQTFPTSPVLPRVWANGQEVKINS